MVLWSLLADTGNGAVLHAAIATDAAFVEIMQRCGNIPDTESPPLRLRPDVLLDFQPVLEACTSCDPRARPGMGGVATLLLDLVEGDGRWEVDRSSLTTIQKLGEGQFGDVIKMATSLFSDDGSVDFVAVKVLKLNGAGGENAAAMATKLEADFVAEMELMKRLRHPNLVTLLGVCTRELPFLAVLEFLKGGSLDVWLPANGHLLLKPAPTKLVYVPHNL
jgi:hypothetical protein